MLKEESVPYDDTWVCAKCCASNVEEKVWVKINSYNGHMAEVVGDGGDNFFCPECNQSVAVVQYCDFAVEDDTESSENARLDKIITESDRAMQRNVDKWNKKMKGSDK